MAAWFALAATLGNGVFSPLRAQAADLYWDANGAAAGTGGTGTWTAANLWRNGSDVGALQNWADANNAFLQGTAGNITIGSTAVAPLTTFVQVTGYTIQTDSATGRTLGGAINLSSSVNLGILEAAQTAARTINIGSVTGGAGSTLTIQGTQGSGLAARVNLNQASSSIDVPIIINQAGAGVAGIVATNTGVSLTSNATITNNSTGMTILGATSGNSLTVNGAVSGTAGLMFAAGGSGGAGTITLNAANTYQGATAFNAANSGLIKLGINNALSTVSNVTMGFSASNGGILDLNGFNQEIASLTNGAGGGSITNNAAGAGTNTLMISGSTSPAAFTLNITDGATAKTGIERSGTGTLTLGGTVNHNTYSGATTITSGTIKAAAASVFSANSVHSVGASGTLDLGGFSNSVGLLAGSGSVISSAAGSVTLNLAGTSGSQSFGGTVQDGSGAVSLGKSGGSTQIFTSANTYTGTTAISGGTLLANNGSGSATGTGNITVTGGTFGGSGSVTGSVTLNANGILSAGSGLGLAGMLTTGAQTWNSSAGLNFDINDANGSAGNAFDTLSIVGGLNLSALTTSSFNVNLFSRDTSGNPTSSVTNFNNGLDYSWTLATASGGITGFNAANFSIIQTGFTAPLNGGTFTLATSGNNLNLLFTHGSYAPKNLTWTNASADGLWNATSVNWTEPPATAFTNTDNVTFDSSATPGTVTVDAGGVTPGSVVVSNTSGTYTFAGGSIGGSGSLTKSGAGTLVLSPTSSNAYAGGTFANGGTLAIANDNALGNLSGAVTFNGGTLRTDAAITSSRALTVSSGGATIDTNGFDSILTPSSAIALTGSFTKSGAGSLDVRTNGFSGAGTVNVTGGQLTLGDTTSAASNPITFLGNGTNSLNLNGGGLRIAASTTGTLASAGNTIAGTSTVTLFQTATTAAAMTHTIGGTTSVSGTLSIEAAGNVTTGGNSNSRLILGTTSYAGATTFQMAASGAAGNVTASNLTLGATIDNGFQTTFLSQGSATQLPGNGAFLNTASTFTGNWVIGNTTGTGGVIVSLGVPGSQAQAAMTSGDITVNPFGQLFFFTSPTPTFGNSSQTITLNGIGTQLADFSAGNSGALRFDASGTNSVAFQGNLNIGNLVGGATISIGGNDTLAVNGSVAFNGTLQKQGSGTLVLNGTGSGSGGTSVGNGTLTIASAAALGSGAISVASGATLHVTGSLDLAGSQLITNNGTITGVVNVNSGSTAKGSGAYGSLAINSGGTISPGNSPGLMAMSDLAINGGNYLWELGALSTSNPGTDFDQVQVNSGNATLTGGTVTLDFSILGNNAPDGSNADPFWNAMHQWTILTVTGGGTLSGTFGSLVNDTFGVGTFALGYTPGVNGTVALTFTPGMAAVPEPSSLLLVGAIAGPWAWYRRRKRQAVEASCDQPAAL